MKSRLQEKYRMETVPALMKRFGWKNMMAVPKLQKITVNIGLGEASQNAKLLDTAAVELGQITGQKAVITRAKKSIANFKIRKGMPIGCAVTLRGDHMYEFLDRLCNVVLPRVRDFRGLPQNSFDGRGNYTLGLKDQLVFPEIDYTRVDKIKGMNITMTTSAKNDEQGRELLKGLGVPLREKGATQQMARTAKIAKTLKKPKFKVRVRNRCRVCGRARGYIRKFQMCRICFRGFALKGEIPGVVKASW